MAYKVLNPFRDKTNKSKLVKKDDTYTHKDSERIAFLIKKGFLEDKGKKTSSVKHIGGGWYELPNGEKAKGKKEALAKLESGE